MPRNEIKTVKKREAFMKIIKCAMVTAITIGLCSQELYAKPKAANITKTTIGNEVAHWMGKNEESLKRNDQKVLLASYLFFKILQIDEMENPEACANSDTRAQKVAQKFEAPLKNAVKAIDEMWPNMREKLSDEDGSKRKVYESFYAGLWKEGDFGTKVLKEKNIADYSECGKFPVPDKDWRIGNLLRKPDVKVPQECISVC